MRMDENFTLEELIRDPMTQLVMRSDNVSAADMLDAFAQARTGGKVTFPPDPPSLVQ